MWYLPRVKAQPPLLPPTSASVLRDDSRPYFLWWTDVSVGELRRLLRDPDRATRAYWMGALLREANSRDVWQFARPEEIRELFPDLVRHLGRGRAMWAWLLGLAEPEWPPREARVG